MFLGIYGRTASNTAGDSQVIVFIADLKSFGLCPDAVAYCDTLINLGSWKNYEEFLTTVATDSVKGSATLSEKVGKSNENLITSLVTAGVVHSLESVQIQHHDAR